jgi:hypothetical protein
MENFENLRTILQIAYERVNHLAGIIQIINGFIVTLVIGIIVLRINEPLFAEIIIVLLIVWRFYARLLDNEIIEQYGKIISCERELEIPEEFALVKSLTEKFPKNRISEYSTLSLEDKYREFPYLIETKQVSHRQHDWYDLLAIFGIYISTIGILNSFDIENIIQNLLNNTLLFLPFFIIWWLIENLFIVRNPPPVSKFELKTSDKVIYYAQISVNLIYLVAVFIGIFILILCIILIDWLIIKLLYPVADYRLFFLFSIILIGYAINTGLNTSKRTQDLIEKYPQSNFQIPHHAIIISHKKPPNEKGFFDEVDYSDGIDILIDKFRSHQPQINYQVYDVRSREEVKPIIYNTNATHLWIFGHGARHKLRLLWGDLNYYDVRDAPKKEFIGQYHCNSLFWKSLVDYNKPTNSDVTWWFRWGPFIRFSVRKKLKDLGI